MEFFYVCMGYVAALAVKLGWLIGREISAAINDAVKK